MKATSAALAVLGAAALLSAGCGGGSPDANARMLIEPIALAGKFMLGATANGAGLVAMKQISETRRIMGMGVEIDVWVIKARQPKDKSKWAGPKGTVLLLHPLTLGKSWFLPLGALMARRGWDVVLPDLRAHGRSGGKYITWGVSEKHDLESVMDALTADGTVSDRIYVCGASLGGTVAIQYAALDRRVRGVMAISPPASLKTIGRRMLPLETQRDYEQALWKAGAIAGFDPYLASSVDAARRLACPLVLAHGVFDVIVPYSHSRLIYKAAHQPKRLITQAFQGHDAGMAQDLWIASQIEKLAKTGMVPRPLPAETVTPEDLEDFDEQKILEEIRQLEAIEKSIGRKRGTRKRGADLE